MVRCLMSYGATLKYSQVDFKTRILKTEINLSQLVKRP